MSLTMTQNTTEEERVPLLNGTENNQLGDVLQSQYDHQAKTFTFTTDREFWFLRWLLRILSLWSPRSSCCFSRYIYPALVNILLALVTVYYLAWSKSIPTIRIAVITMSAGGYFSHLAGLFYFRSRDLESNMAYITVEGSRVKRFRLELKYFNLRTLSTILLSFFFAVQVMLNSGDTVWFIPEGFITPFLCAHVYMLGMYFAMLWIIDLLQLTSGARLKDQHHKFIKWTLGAQEAINCHIGSYTLRVENTCRRLQWWFLVHNISLTIMVPCFVLGDFQGRLPWYNPFIVGGVTAVILIWALPLYFAEQIQKNDERFCSKVNNFCLEQLLLTVNAGSREAVVNMDCDHDAQNVENLTFTSRKEVQLLVDYLKNIRSGFLSVGYSFQLKLSLFATVLSLAALIFKTTQNNHD